MRPVLALVSARFQFCEVSFYRYHPKLDCNSISMEVSLNCTKFEENELREKTLRISSTKTPKNMVSETRGIGCSFMET